MTGRSGSFNVRPQSDKRSWARRRPEKPLARFELPIERSGDNRRTTPHANRYRTLKKFRYSVSEKDECKEHRAAALRPVDLVMNYQITIRFGGRHQRYHTFKVSADDAAEALRQAADKVPKEIASDVDLVELRVAINPDKRSYLDETSSGA